MRFSAFPFYLSLSILFSFLYLFFEAPRLNTESAGPLSAAHKLYLLLFYVNAGAGLGALSAVVYWENSAFMILASLVFLALFCLSFLKKDFTRKLLSLVFLVVSENLILFYFPEPLKKADYDRIRNQKHVTPVFWFTNETIQSSLYGALALPKRFGSIRTLLMDGNEKQLFFILHGPPVPHRIAVKLSIENPKSSLSAKTKIRWLSAKRSDNAGARDMALGEGQNILYVLGINGTVFQIDTRTFKFKRAYATGMKRMMRLLLMKDNQTVLLLSETGHLKKYRLPSWTLMKSSETNGNAYALLPSRDEKFLYVVQWGKSTVLEVNVKTLKILREIQSAPYYPVGGDLNERGRVIYFTDYVRGQVLLLDLRDFSISDAFKIKRGLREARWDARRNVLYMGNFQKGSFYIFDVKRGIILKELFLGRKLRHIYITPKTHQVLVATRYGVFRVDVDGLLKTMGQKKTPSR